MKAFEKQIRKWSSGELRSALKTKFVYYAPEKKAIRKEIKRRKK